VSQNLPGGNTPTPGQTAPAAQQPPPQGGVGGTAQAATAQNQQPAPSGTAGNKPPTTTAPQAPPSGNLGRIVAATILGLCILFGLLYIGSLTRSCSGVPVVSSNDGGIEGGSTPLASHYLTEAEAMGSELCNAHEVRHSSDRYYAIQTIPQTKRTHAVKLCPGPGNRFHLAENTRVTDDKVYITEGGYTTVANRVSGEVLSQKLKGKTNLVTAEGHDFANPEIVYLRETPAFDYCQQYKMSQRPKGNLADEDIWDRCAWGKKVTPAQQEYLLKKHGQEIAVGLAILDARLTAQEKRPIPQPPPPTTYDPRTPVP